MNDFSTWEAKAEMSRSSILGYKRVSGHFRIHENLSLKREEKEGLLILKTNFPVQENSYIIHYSW